MILLSILNEKRKKRDILSICRMLIYKFIETEFIIPLIKFLCYNFHAILN